VIVLAIASPRLRGQRAYRWPDLFEQDLGAEFVRRFDAASKLEPGAHSRARDVPADPNDPSGHGETASRAASAR